MSERFVVSARKYRPGVFGTVIGQSHVTRILKNAIRTDHLAQAFLFCGPRGVGKTTCARILAKTLNCTNLSEDIEPCNMCPSCLSFLNGTNVNIMELDAASNNSVEGIRTLVDQVRYAPQGGRFKVYIIDEVHMLSTAAFNAFLKTLEEPPSYVIFILATTEKHKILPTILSRCQIFDFNRITAKDTVLHLEEICKAENVTCDPAVLHLIAQKADGGMRDALSIFDQLVTLSNGNITYAEAIQHLNLIDIDHYFTLVDAFVKNDLTSALTTLHQILAEGFDGLNLMLQLGEHMRHVLLARDPKTLSLLPISEALHARYQAQSERVPPSLLLTALHLLTQSELPYKSSKNQQLFLEVVFMRLCFLKEAVDASVQDILAQNGATHQQITPHQNLQSQSNAVGATSLAPIGYQTGSQQRSPSGQVTQTQPIGYLRSGDNGNAPQTTPSRSLTGVSLPKSLEAVRKQAAASLEKTHSQERTYPELNQESLRQAIDEFIEASLTTRTKLFLSLIRERSFALNEAGLIEILLSDDVQKARFFDEKSHLLQFIRAHFGLPSLTIESVVTPDFTPVTKSSMTHSEFFMSLLASNPNLAEFRELLDLDLE